LLLLLLLALLKEEEEHNPHSEEKLRNLHVFSTQKQILQILNGKIGVFQ
jgi:hypothetical protein